MPKPLSPERAAQIAEYIKSHWAYDRATGVITGRCGKPVGTLRKDGALQALAYIPGKPTAVLLHRAAWLLEAGDWPLAEIDHKDGDRANNRWKNLRLATRSQNRQNLKGRNGKGNLRGCTPYYRKWRAQIRAPGSPKPTYLGLFDTQEQAHAAYCAAKKRAHLFNPEQRVPEDEEPLG